MPSGMDQTAVTAEMAQQLFNTNIESSVEITSEKLLQKVPKSDGGKHAWLFLAGGFFFEALVWGFPFCFGVFESFYTTHPPFNKHPSGIAAIGTCSTGVMYLFAPVSLYILEAWPSVRRISSIFGLALILTALVTSSFATQVWHLIFTQGILYAIGGSFLYAPIMFYLDEWFIHKKGLAFGIMWAGVGSAGVIFPFFLNYLLNAQGFAITLRIWSLILLVLCSPLIYFVKPRIPLPKPPPPRQKISYSFLKTRTHLFLQASNILESLGFFLPSIYLPSYASSLSLSPVSSTILLAVLNSFSVLGAVGMGLLCDRLHVTTVIGISTVGATVSVFLCWGLGVNLPVLIVFAATYGIFAGGYSAIWSGMMKEVMKQDESARMGTLMGVFAAGRGIGAVASGPLSEVLLKGVTRVASPTRTEFGYGTQYGVLIVFTGVSALAGIVAFGARRFG